ncbi:uncharacterized protein RCO7_14170 [Rhynchosporium graminicola]|uniref:Uncharacterized protein n=1 Tax=Rhynchosporium graminicola TaxID=2792576 RepID=A0A1E1JVP4_9HELO|nr:uncharacterized protein RCO7_14170 [Rhynchosporium commune]
MHRQSGLGKKPISSIIEHHQAGARVTCLYMSIRKYGKDGREGKRYSQSS